MLVRKEGRQGRTHFVFFFFVWSLAGEPSTHSGHV
jgi:hypothetical protein